MLFVLLFALLVLLVLLVLFVLFVSVVVVLLVVLVVSVLVLVVSVLVLVLIMRRSRAPAHMFKTCLWRLAHEAVPKLRASENEAVSELKVSYYRMG